MKTCDISVEYVDHMGSDLSIVNAARVSFAKTSQLEWDAEGVAYLKEGDVKLINYLAKHKHYSPFNHTFLTFRIKAPIFVARQLVKHEYMPWNEVSRRYVDSEPEFYIPPSLLARAENVKQGASDNTVSVMKGDYGFRSVPKAVEQHTESCLTLYNELLAAGVAPEEARMVLPHNLMTEWIWSGTLKAFHKMLSLRLDPHIQYHTRRVAEMILPEIEKIFPISIKALLENN